MTAPRAGALGPLALGLSGGGDSLALLALTRRRTPDRPIVAIIIDHALRPGSAEDAARASAIARELGAKPVVRRLAWTGAPPRSQAAARIARYRAFAEEMRTRGAATLLLGHTADDQLETILLRSDAASGPYGRAGMAVRAPLPLWPEGRGLRVERPLLATRRADLRDWLKGEGLAWIEDPANADPRFARVRARAALAARDPAVLDAAWLQATEAAASAAALDAAAAAALSQLEIGGQGDLSAPAAALDALSPSARRRAFAALVAAASGVADPPPGAGLARLAERGWASAALAGAVFRRDPANGAREGAGRLRVRRDPGAVLGRGGRGRPGLTPLPLEAPVIWDRRLELRAHAPGLAVTPGPSARAGVKLAVSGPGGHWSLDAAREAGLVTAAPLAAEIVAHVLWRAHDASHDGEGPAAPPESAI